jgi:hypothetical protein
MELSIMDYIPGYGLFILKTRRKAELLAVHGAWFTCDASVASYTLRQAGQARVFRSTRREGGGVKRPRHWD